MRPFLYHIRPRIYAPGLYVKLVELRIDALGLHLKGGDLRTGRPYPNKNYDVGHRRIGRKHVDGILLSLSDWPPDFEVQAHWAVAAEYVATHKVIYTLLDEDFGAASDDMTLWYAASAPITRENLDPPLEFQNRFPHWAKDIPPVRAEPCMQVFPKQPDEHDLFDYKGQLVERTEVFPLPTIEPERFLGTKYPRERIALPTLEMAIKL
jgi:uncharacterized protein DUF6012